MSDDEPELDRRSVLRNAGLAAGGVLALSATAAADAPEQDPDPDVFCGYDCFDTGSFCDFGLTTYEVYECCKYPDGSTDCTTYYTCGCPSECGC